MIKFSNIAVVRRNRELTFVSSDIIEELTLDELRDKLHKSIDKYIEFLKTDSKDHKCNKGVVVHPLIHLIYDDLNTEEDVKLLNSIYAKNLN